MLKKLKSFIRDESGTTSMEYALIGLVISVVIVASVISIGSTVAGMFQAFFDLFTA